MWKRYLFVGEESYLIRKELTRWSEQFLQKYGPDTVMSLSLGEYNPQEIFQMLCSGGLFSEDKLIIVYDIPGQTTSPAGTAELEQSLMDHREQLYSDYFIIFVSPKPDKRKKSYKFFAEHCEIKEFKPMDMRSLPKFLTNEFDLYNTSDSKLTRDHIDLLVELVGTDGSRLHHEIKKLTQYLASTNQKLTKEIIQTVVVPSQESSAFELLDKLIKEPSRSILDNIATLQDNGEVRQMLQGWLLWWLKNIIAYGLCLHNNQDPKTLSLSPFVAGKYNKYQDNIINNLQEFQQLYFWLIDFEYALKTGQADQEWYRLTLKSLLSENNFV